MKLEELEFLKKEIIENAKRKRLVEDLEEDYGVLEKHATALRVEHSRLRAKTAEQETELSMLKDQLAEASKGEKACV